MKIIVCVDNQNGMMFNHRRQSQDRVLRKRILELTGGKKLWMNAYSQKQFLQGNMPKEQEQSGQLGQSGQIQADETFLEKAGPGDKGGGGLPLQCGLSKGGIIRIIKN